jgi:hypothetical protein
MAAFGAGAHSPIPDNQAVRCRNGTPHLDTRVNPTGLVQVVLIDPSGKLLPSAATLLAASPAIRLVGCAASPERGLALVHAHQVDVAVIVAGAWAPPLLRAIAAVTGRARPLPAIVVIEPGTPLDAPWVTGAAAVLWSDELPRWLTSEILRLRPD